MNIIVQKIVLLFCICSIQFAFAVEIQTIKIVYITQELQVPSALSNLDAFVQNKGMKGADMAIVENNTTGKFTEQAYKLTKIIVPVSENVAEVFNQKVTDDVTLVISNLPADKLIHIATLGSSKGILFFDATTTDDSLRSEQCFKNILHMLPSRAMRADALAQYMLKKRWNKWFLVTGMAQDDQHYSIAIKRAVKRFGIKLVAEKQWTHTYDARRTAQSDIPVFTQGVEYDVLVVADEQGLFGEYINYRSWIPRPVIGTQGLVATSWHRTHEQWGAVQIQNRFKDQVGRWMEEQDYGAYLAVRAIGEASVRTKSNNMQTIKDYLLSDEFALQGYKGKPLSFRTWNGQLRQPVLLAAARSLVAVAPIEGFLHPITEMDTLGYDQTESSCLDGFIRKQLKPSSTLKDSDGENGNIFKKIKKQIINKLKQYQWN